VNVYGGVFKAAIFQYATLKHRFFQIAIPENASRQVDADELRSSKVAILKPGLGNNSIFDSCITQPHSYKAAIS
jgi:hypothetical protein